MIDFFLVIVGLGGLIGGGDLLLRGAVNVASSFGMSRLLIGLTVVSLGTSAPEMAICLDAAVDGKPEIALGNIIGSNVANVLLILGLTSLVMPIVVERKIIYKEVPVMIGASLLFLGLVTDGYLSPTDGYILLAGMIGFLGWQFRLAAIASSNEGHELDPVLNSSQSERANSASEPAISAQQESVASNQSPQRAPRLITSFLFIFLGAGLLWFGAGWLVRGASGLASSFGISELVIGLTIVAIGSSAPEIVTSILAARRGYPELSVASVIGSNIANLLLVAGCTAVMSANIEIPIDAWEFDLPVMIVASIACLPIFTTGHRIARWEGILFLMGYTAFTLFLFLRPQMTSWFPEWKQMVWPIATPLIIATVVAITWGWLKQPVETNRPQ